ncbi:glycosyltransferase family 4 protein [Butyrivibrio sp.]|jgi:glycosyltransferase involved in cell wall biosynthesis|uniref:glycosyltransferase family 4 protein n=1 Tax=Butyrivibrio sp. TaxID=28121 RepID=UPI0025C148C1|nr:glycosyltransferase family 4 protein [Butyrivibrio sp.]
MSKILIYRANNRLTPTGGPAGYLYNLREGLKTLEDEHIEVCFLPEEEANTSAKRHLKNYFILRFILDTNLYKAIKAYIHTRKIIKSYSKQKVNFECFDAVHFHTTTDLYRNKDALLNYTGKVILTPHSPEPLFEEYLEKIGLFRIIDKSISKKLKEIDEYAFIRANYIVMPCGFADEAYYSFWEEYSDIKRKKSDNYRFLLTGIKERQIYCSRSEYRKEFNIPENAFVISYVGRHNFAKGYDRLLDLGKIILKKYENVFILIGGAEAPLKGLNHERWIETGWSDRPQDLINASDVFVLPNRETYFDIVLLEVLSLGIPIVASDTGGNKLFRGEVGVRLFEDKLSFIREIETIISEGKDIHSQVEIANKKLYRDFFNEKVFAKQYVKLVSELINSNGR